MGDFEIHPPTNQCGLALGRRGASDESHRGTAFRQKERGDRSLSRIEEGEKNPSISNVLPSQTSSKIPPPRSTHRTHLSASNPPPSAAIHAFQDPKAPARALHKPRIPGIRAPATRHTRAGTRFHRRRASTTRPGAIRFEEAGCRSLRE